MLILEIIEVFLEDIFDDLSFGKDFEETGL